MYIHVAFIVYGGLADILDLIFSIAPNHGISVLFRCNPTADKINMFHENVVINSDGACNQQTN